MRRLYEAADRIEAQCLVDYLSEHGIQAVVLGDFLSGGIGELPADIYPTVWLPVDGQWFMASHLLEEFLSPDSDLGKSWKCVGCGETVEGVFEVCWNCARERPE